MLIRVFYVSTAAARYDDDALNKLCRLSAERNELMGITGALAYDGTMFAQVLEGEAEVVHLLMHKIASDARHDGMITVSEDIIEERAFASWLIQPLTSMNLDSILALGEMEAA